MIEDLSDVVGQFATGSYVVTRRTTTIVNGRRSVSGSPTTVTITGSVQPVDGDKVKALPEGVRLEDTLVLYTPTALQIGGSTTLEPDVVAANGGNYRLLSRLEWAAAGGYYKYLMAKVRE